MRILFLEPFFGGSHGAFVEAFRRGLGEHEVRVLSLPARFWKWRMRGSGVWAADAVRALGGATRFDVVVADAFLPLAESMGLEPSLASVPRVLVFHENQFAYPRLSDAERDHHYAFTQLVSARAATTCVFNSDFNRDTFLAGGRALLRRMPDAVPEGWMDSVEAASVVLPLGVERPLDGEPLPDSAGEGAPLVVWNHRWEHDKGPERLLAMVDALATQGVVFRLALLGERFRRIPPAMEALLDRHAERVVWAGRAPEASYGAWLREASLVVSTAHHEFFGLSMLEALRCGAPVLVPDALVYPELYPRAVRFGSDAELVEKAAGLLRAAAQGEGAPAQRARAWATVDGETRRALEALAERVAPERVWPRWESVLRLAIDRFESA